MKKIEFWRTVGHAYLFLFGDLRRFFVASGAWIAAIVLAAVAAAVLFPLSHVLASLADFIGGVLLTLGGGIAVAVVWHRAILLGERPQVAFRFGHREWRFLGYVLLITLIGLGFILAVGLVFWGIAIGMIKAFGKAGFWFATLSPLAGIVGWGVMARLSLTLPAAAIDEPGGQLRSAWQRGKRNAVRLFFGPILCALPLALIQIALQLLLGPPIWKATTATAMPVYHPGGVQIVLSFLVAVLYFAQTALAVGFLSYSYWQVTGGAAQTTQT